MTKFGKTIIFLVVLILVGVIIFFLQKKPDIVVAPEEIPEIVIPEVPTENQNLEILGNKDDLISFSIAPGTKMPKGILSYRGTIKGAYFFEGNILIYILDKDKKVMKASNAVAKTEWMTAGPVDFEGNIDFTGLSVGPAFFEIHNDNASGLPEKDKSILIPIIKFPVYIR